MTLRGLQAVAKGDQRRWRMSSTVWAGRFTPSLYEFLKDTGHAEDVMQEIFFQI